MISVFSFFTILNSALLSGFVAQIYRFSPFFRVSKRKLYFLTPTFYPLLPRFYSLTRVASCFASGRVRNHIPVPYIYYRYKEKTNLLVTPFTLKKTFFTLTPHSSGWEASCFVRDSMYGSMVRVRVHLCCTVGASMLYISIVD